MLVALLLACAGGPGGPRLALDSGGAVDSGSTAVDADGDGYAAAPDGDDCDDANMRVHPGATEVCGDGVDQDCDGAEVGCTGTLLATSGGGYLAGDELTQGVGRSIRVLPDWGGDGPVLAIGAPLWQPDVESIGRGAVYFVDPRRFGSGQLIDTRADWTWTESVDDADFGWALDVGDLDQDGVTDLLIGMPEMGVHSERNGGAWVVYGPQLEGGDIDTVGDAYLSGPRAQMTVGIAVRIATDATGDGVPDVVLGWPDGCRDDGFGGVIVVNGDRLSTRAIDDRDAGYAGEQRCWTMWGDMATADFDGDGIADLAVSARSGGSQVAATADGGWRSDGLGPGYAYLVLGPLTGGASLADADGRIEGNEPQALLGRATEAAADLDDDGLPELLLGSPWEDRDASTSGAAYVVAGSAVAYRGPVADVAEVQLLGGNEPDLAFGTGMADGGDMDADGHRELIVVAQASGDGDGLYDGQGRAYVFRGPLQGTLGPDDAILEVDGTHGGDGFGLFPTFGGSLCGAIDLNADGHDDWLAGAALASEVGWPGAVYSFYGGAW